MTADRPALAKVHVYVDDPLRTFARLYDPDEGDDGYYLIPAQLLADYRAAETAYDRAERAVKRYIDGHNLTRIYPDDEGA